MVYKGCDIGSAKPDKQILEKYPHDMVDIISPNKIFSVADFCSTSHKTIKKAHLAKKIPLFVGGSMMYFKSLLDGMHDLPDREKNYRAELEQRKLQNGPSYLYDLLKKKDPVYAEKINKNDETRIIRGLEVFKVLNKPLSEILKDKQKKALTNNFSVLQFGIMDERSNIHERIEKRLKSMFDNGLEQEVKNLLQRYKIPKNHPIRKSVNYKQFFSYLNDEYDLETCFDKALYATRQLAKRQSTWIRGWEEFKEIGIKDIKILEDSFKKVTSLL